MKWIKYIGALLVMACSPSLVTDIAYETGEDIECGYNVGEKLCDITLMDQDGNDWNLSAYHGSSPIIAGDRSLIDVSGNSGFPLTSWPTFLIIDKGLNVKWILKGWGEEEIRLLIEDVLKN